MADKIKEESKPEPITNKTRAYMLQFRHKNRFDKSSGKVKEKGFWHAGDLRSATARAREHAEKMDYTYVYCFPLIVDLEDQEFKKSTYEGNDNGSDEY